MPLDNRVEFGVWGGMTERQRRALLRQHPKSTPGPSSSTPKTPPGRIEELRPLAISERAPMIQRGFRISADSGFQPRLTICSATA